MRIEKLIKKDVHSKGVLPCYYGNMQKVKQKQKE